jgi:hypothetical protein
MKVCKHEFSRMLSGKQEGTLNESLCAEARQTLRIFKRLLFLNLKSRRYRNLPAHQSELET